MGIVWISEDQNQPVKQSANWNALAPVLSNYTWNHSSSVQGREKVAGRQPPSSACVFCQIWQSRHCWCTAKDEHFTLLLGEMGQNWNVFASPIAALSAVACDIHWSFFQFVICAALNYSKVFKIRNRSFKLKSQQGATFMFDSNELSCWIRKNLHAQSIENCYHSFLWNYCYHRVSIKYKELFTNLL